MKQVIRTNWKKLCIIAVLMGSPLILNAQESNTKALPHEIPSPDRIAKRETDTLNKVLQLDEKQYEKVYKLNLKEQQSRFEMMTKRNATMEGSDIQPKGKMTTGDKEQLQGRPPMMRGGRPPMDGGKMGMPPEFNKDKNKSCNEMEKQVVEKQKKMKKILTDDQYNKWLEFEVNKHKRFSQENAPS